MATCHSWAHGKHWQQREAAGWWLGSTCATGCFGLRQPALIGRDYRSHSRPCAIICSRRLCRGLPFTAKGRDHRADPRVARPCMRRCVRCGLARCSLRQRVAWRPRIRGEGREEFERCDGSRIGGGVTLWQRCRATGVAAAAVPQLDSGIQRGGSRLQAGEAPPPRGCRREGRAGLCSWRSGAGRRSKGH